MEINSFYRQGGKKIIIIYVLFLIFSGSRIYGQEYFYRVTFRDKGEYTTGSFTPEQLLSERAIARRQKAGIETPGIPDLPVFAGYLKQIADSGYTLHCTSKWMNSALFKTPLPADINSVLQLPFVADIKLVKTPGIKSRYTDKLEIIASQDDPSAFDRPVTMVNGHPLHNSGYNGKGILIAILDGGFTNADHISSLKQLYDRNGVESTHDFVMNRREVYNMSNHGTAVLSVLAGNIPGSIEGTAREARYLLIKTEDVETEFPCEEDYWAAGAEYADSAGADIISSSLGYSTFDDPSMNYKIRDLDGKTAFVTKAAEIAASRGIAVFNSAGNERTNDWKYIIFPSDGEMVEAVGAVDGNDNIASFSSAGPSSDRRIKPDNVTMGVSVPLQTAPAGTIRSSGTSFSCPVLSGMAACLMQAVPEALNTDIINSLHSGADRYNSPDSLYGYGIPDMVSVLAKLQDKFVRIPDSEIILSPNPTPGNIDITFLDPPGSLKLEIISMSGEIIYSIEYPEFAGRTIHLTELSALKQGIYFIRIKTPAGTRVHKIIKIG